MSSVKVAPRRRHEFFSETTIFAITCLGNAAPLIGIEKQDER